MGRNVTIVVIILIIVLSGVYLVWLRNHVLSNSLNMESSGQDVSPVPSSLPIPSVAPSPSASASASVAPSPKPSVKKVATPSAKIK